MDNFLAITKALSDSNRVRALHALVKGELCACQIIELLDLAPSTVSKHMTILKQARLVKTRKEGRWVHYSLPSDNLPVMVGEAIDWVKNSLSDDALAKSDLKRLKKIAKMEVGEPCSP